MDPIQQHLEQPLVAESKLVGFKKASVNDVLAKEGRLLLIKSKQYLKVIAFIKEH